jgi:Holliday junction resolvase
MSEIINSQHDKKIEEAADELRRSGYKVIIDPSSTEMPFDLGNYRPDLVAIKNGEGIILEVKASHARLSVDRFQEIAEQVAKHSGWKFILVTLDDMFERIILSEKGDLLSWCDLQTHMEKIDELFRDGLYEPGVLYLWSTIEAMLRKRSIAESIPIYRFPPAKLLNHMYSSGEISIADYDSLKAIFEKRNKVAHGLVVHLEIDELTKAAKVARELLGRWREDKSQK